MSRANQVANVYTNTFDYVRVNPDNENSSWTILSVDEPERPTRSAVVATRVFRPEDGLDYASTLTTATVTI